MDNSADAGAARPKRRYKPREKLPPIVVATRGELADTMRTWRWLVYERAALFLDDADAVEEAVRRTTLKLLAVEDPRSTHALRWILSTLRNECRAVARRRQRLTQAKEDARLMGAPVDRFLGALDGAKAEAVAKLDREYRDVLTLAAEGVRPSDIAEILGISPKTARNRLWQARKLVLEAVGDAKPRALALATWGAFHDPLARVSVQRPRSGCQAPRLAVSRLAALLNQVDATQLTAVAAVLVAAVGSATPLPVATQLGPAAGVSWAQPARDGAAPVGRSAPASTPDATTAGEPLPLGARALHVSLPLPNSTTESPSDTQFVSLARPSGGGSDGVLVALGVGHTCLCRTLFQSTDNGRTWTADEQRPPNNSQQVALPTDYPRDGRIFVGTDRSSGTAPSVAANFGAPFRTISNLLPPGHISLAAGFDSGDPRMFVAGSTEVVSFALGDTAPVPLVTYSPLDVPAVLASPRDDGTTAVFMAVPPTAQVPEDPTAASNMAGSPRLVACGSRAGCSVTAAIPLAAVESVEVSSVSGRPAILAASTRALALSEDGGSHFYQVTLPPGVSSLSSATITLGSAWVVTAAGDGRHVERVDLGRTTWTDLAVGALPEGEGQVVALSPMRLLYLPAGSGYLCSEDGGVSWTHGCL